MVKETSPFKKRFLILLVSIIILLFSSSLVHAQWSSVSPPSVSADWELEGVYFTSSSDGWAVGYDYTNSTNSKGVLLHYYSSPSPQPIPTMTEWGMIIFIVIAGLGSIYYMRRKRRVES